MTLSTQQDSYSAPWPNVRFVWPRPRTWRMIQDYHIEWTAEGFPRQRLIAPAAFECNGSSQPTIVEWYLDRGLILREAFFHDLIYAYRGDLPPEFHLYLDEDGEWKPTYFTWGRKDGDRLFARILAINDFIRDDQRRLAYQMVRAFGWKGWNRVRPRPTIVKVAELGET